MAGLWVFHLVFLTDKADKADKGRIFSIQESPSLSYSATAERRYHHCQCHPRRHRHCHAQHCLQYTRHINSCNDFLCIIADMNECDDAAETHCSINSECINIPGSYICQCVSGYQDTGELCVGELLY